MNGLIISEHGKIRKADDLELAEKIIDLKQEKDHWVVIDELIKAWSERAPEQTEALKVEIEDYRESLDDKRFGQTRGGKDFERRFTLVFPISLQSMIRSIYKVEDLPFTREFYKEFSKRYPFFRISEVA